MTSPDDVTEDRGFKELFTSYPFETVEVFAPELLAQRGRPARIEALQQELALPDLGQPSRFLDVALLCTWSDGAQAVILLVEHWSESRKVDLRRVLWYYAGLGLKHPAAVVFPVVLVTDRSAREVPERLESSIAGSLVLDFRVRVVRIGPQDQPWLNSLRNRVAAVFLAMAIKDAVDAVDTAVTVMLAMQRAPGPVDDLRRFLPLVQKLARMLDSDEPRFRRRMREEPTMGNMLDDIKSEGVALGEAKGEAKGVAKGEALGKISEIRRLVSKGRLTVDAARSEIEELIAAQVIPEALGREALGQIG
jgi:hypothetical protein